MPKKHNLSDIAKLAGVSVSSVSRVLNNGPGVKPEKREAVALALKETGYRQNTLLYGAGQTGSKTIGLVLPNLCNPFFAELAACVQDRLLEKGYMVSVFNSYFDPEREKRSLALLRDSAIPGPVDGLIINSCLGDAEAESCLRGLGCPITLLDRALDLAGAPCNSVIQDNFQAGYLAAKHLLELGHRRILFLAGVPNSRSSMDRVEGYRKALESAFIPVDEGLIACGPMGLERGAEAATAYLKQPAPRPTAVIAANDETAIGFMDACRGRGVSIPGALSVVGFDDIAIAALGGIGLTTVRQSIDEMGKSAVEATLQSIQNPGAASVRKLLLQPQLIVRGSTAQPENRAP